MAKTLISRLDAENIVRAAVDPETHEATGDVYDSVNDVSYPFGGSGSDIRFCTVTFNNTSGSAISIASADRTKLLPFQDNGTVKFMSSIPTGETVVKLLYYTTDGNTYLAIGYDTTGTASDAENCMLVAMGGNILMITDPTADSSITLTYAGSD